MIRSILLSLALAGYGFAQEAVSTAYLKNGKTVQGPVKSVTRTKVEFGVGDGGGSVGYNHNEIEYVAFPPTKEWAEAMNLFNRREYETAAEKFEKIAANRGKTSFYPAPGNLSTMADRRLLDCYRRSIQADKIPAVSNRIEWDRLPPDEQSIKVVAGLWSSFGVKDWEGVINSSDAAIKDLGLAHSSSNEIAYLRGMAYEAKGDADEAIIAYGLVIGPFPGANRRTSADALQRSIQLLVKNPDRAKELKAQLQIYAKSFGNGKLWDGAPEELKTMIVEK